MIENHIQNMKYMKYNFQSSGLGIMFNYFEAFCWVRNWSHDSASPCQWEALMDANGCHINDITSGGLQQIVTLECGFWC